jgi:hypothetical protein
VSRLLSSLAVLGLVAPAVIGLPVATAPTPKPHPVAPSGAHVALSALPSSTASGPALRRSAVGLAARATTPFTTLGVSWRLVPRVSGVTASVRWRQGSTWSGWRTLSGDRDDVPDAGSRDTGPALRDGTEPYDVDDPTGPRSAYGRTKLAGELAVREILPAASYVVRTAWVYGATGSNFVKTMARLESERETVSVVDDQRGSPTWSRDLAAGLLVLAGSDAPAGTYHATNAGDTTWHGFTRAIFEELGADPARVLPTTSDAYPRPAPRPAYSVLSPRAWDSAGLPALRGWREALAEAFRTSGDAFRP